MTDVGNIVIGLSIVLVGVLIATAGAFIVVSPAKWFGLVNRWSRFISRGPLSQDSISSDVLRSAPSLFTFRLSGLAILIIALFFVFGAGKATIEEFMGSRSAGPIQRPESPPPPVAWTGIAAAILFLSIGIGLLYKPIATIRFVSPHLFSSETLADPRAAFALRIMGMGLSLAAFFMLGVSVF